jgi:hypothetical protein
MNNPPPPPTPSNPLASLHPPLDLSHPSTPSHPSAPLSLPGPSHPPAPPDSSTPSSVPGLLPPSSSPSSVPGPLSALSPTTATPTTPGHSSTPPAQHPSIPSPSDANNKTQVSLTAQQKYLDAFNEFQTSLMTLKQSLPILTHFGNVGGLKMAQDVQLQLKNKVTAPNETQSVLDETCSSTEQSCKTANAIFNSFRSHDEST